MKINLKIRSFPHRTETFIVHHIIGLLKQGVKVQIYANAYHGLTAYLNPEKIKAYQIDNLVHKNIKVKKGIYKVFQVMGLLMNPKIISYAVKYYFFTPQWSLKPLYSLYNYKDFDDSLVCHIQFNTSIKPLLDLTAIGFLKPKKVLITFHGYDAFRLNKEVFNKRYAEFYKNCVYAVTVNSNYVKQHLIKAGISENIIKIVPMGIEVDMFKNLQIMPQQSKIIKLVSVGRLIQLKGHKYGMQVLRQLLEKGYNATYTIVGDGLVEYKNELREEVRKLGCEKEVVFTGAKTQEEVKEILMESSVFLMTSTFDDLTGRQEAFGIAIVEAQACGLPVVAFESGGVPEVLINGVTGFLVEDRNVHEMAQKVELLC
ncbi:glycosyltransferase family 4 protein, partial [Mesoflavibacter zeaxanthinifaciens]|uniref:glycosyltransferase family 4 protein n=1 Tax=Mesoflavibacter zeaxanthinifaciens TaxID=393060 RepID=UPI003A93041C